MNERRKYKGRETKFWEFWEFWGNNEERILNKRSNDYYVCMYY